MGSVPARRTRRAASQPYAPPRTLSVGFLSGWSFIASLPGRRHHARRPSVSAPPRHRPGRPGLPASAPVVPLVRLPNLRRARILLHTEAGVQVRARPARLPCPVALVPAALPGAHPPDSRARSRTRTAGEPPPRRARGRWRAGRRGARELAGVRGRARRRTTTPAVSVREERSSGESRPAGLADETHPSGRGRDTKHTVEIHGSMYMVRHERGRRRREGEIARPRTHTLSPVYPWAHLRCLSSSSSA